MYPIGCSGVITHVDQLADGRYNIVLRGVERFRIVEEDFDGPTVLPASSRSPNRALEAEDRGVRSTAALEAGDVAGVGYRAQSWKSARRSAGVSRGRCDDPLGNG